MEREIDNSVLLITGGTGSFGNAAVGRFLKQGVREIRILSRDEKKQHDMRVSIGDDRIKFILGDVRDYETVLQAMEGVDYVFQAAALKQVPSCEFYPMEAVKTNVVGTHNVVRAATICGVKVVVCLSTDKAAYPINAMGMSKALMEKVAIAKARDNGHTGTIITVTRYGNVMASRGSVIPHFISLINDGKTLTVTHESMTRFLMSLDEAVELVNYAFTNANQGDLFVQKAPACTIYNLAEAINKRMGVSMPIEITGIRHGEKLYETLCTSEEMIKAVDESDFFRIPMDARDLNYDKYYNSDKIQTQNHIEDYNSNNTEMLTVDEICDKLISIGI